MRQRTPVDVFEFAAYGYAMGDAAGLDLPLGSAFTEEVRRGLTFDGRIRGENHLVHLARIEQCFVFTRADLFGADAVEWREMAVQNEISPPIAAGLLHGNHIGRGLHHA